MEHGNLYTRDYGFVRLQKPMMSPLSFPVGEKAQAVDFGLYCFSFVSLGGIKLKSVASEPDDPLC